MLNYLILVVQNSLTTAILLALLYAVFPHIGEEKEQKYWFWGSAAGIAAAGVLAFLKHTTTLVNREWVNIGTLSFAILLTLLFLALLWGFARHTSPRVPHGLWRGVGALLPATLLFYNLPDLFLYPTDFALMEESILNTAVLLKLIGYGVGLLLVLLSAYALYQTGTVPSFSFMRLALTAGLALLLFSHTATIVQILLARRIIPMQPWLFDTIRWVLNHNSYFLYLLLGITLIFPMMVWILSWRPGENYSNPAEHRKLRALARSRRRFCEMVVAGYVLAVLNLTVAKAYNEREVVLSPAEPITLVDDDVVIPVDMVNDGHLHRFVYTAADGTEVRFIVIQKNQVAFGVGLDACNICGASGYYERDGKVICKLCDVAINISTIGFKGGCNPIPLAYTLADGNLLIRAQDLEAETKIFG